MKLKNLLLLLSFLFAFSFAIAQGEEEEPQMFGSKRAIEKPQKNTLDFGTLGVVTKSVGTTTQAKSFVIKNTSTVNMIISDIVVPEGISVTIDKKELAPNEETKLNIEPLMDKLPKGKFQKEIIVKSEKTDASGNKLPKDEKFIIKGVNP